MTQLNTHKHIPYAIIYTIVRIIFMQLSTLILGLVNSYATLVETALIKQASIYTSCTLTNDLLTSLDVHSCVPSTSHTSSQMHAFSPDHGMFQHSCCCIGTSAYIYTILQRVMHAFVHLNVNQVCHYTDLLLHWFTQPPLHIHSANADVLIDVNPGLPLKQSQPTYWG